MESQTQNKDYWERKAEELALEYAMELYYQRKEELEESDRW